ncbi:MAG: hypothetical protein KDD69_03840 [Bdellovibrionales bacterium]|nr:hypothetical protein [Bdellovibrionales bacterium]
MNRISALLIAGALALGVTAQTAVAEDEGGKGYGHRGQKLFEMADADKNDSVSREEFLKAHEARSLERFSRLDADGDGNITKEEFRNHKKERRERFRKCMRNDSE